MGKTKRQAATAKKGRLNILRIYRRNKNVKDCNKITRDMEYIDKKYKLGKTIKNLRKNAQGFQKVIELNFSTLSATHFIAVIFF